MLLLQTLVLSLACGASLANAFLLTPSKLAFKSMAYRRIRFHPTLAVAVQQRGMHRMQASSDRDTTRPLVLGLNKYSHDSAVCIIDAITNEIIFAGEKERLTRKKHDAGAVGDLITHALEAVGGTLDDVCLVVQNNHHHRIGDFEARLPFAVAMQHYPGEYLEADNLLTGVVRKLELSHHLAHAWCAIGTSPWSPLSQVQMRRSSEVSPNNDDKTTLVVIMDGMGETQSAMTLGASDSSYHTDLTETSSSSSLTHEVGESREAESAYLFNPKDASISEKYGPTLKPFWKRFTKERSPSALENHGFENMESMGAMYSRVSSAIFGDWNACGKVMGLAPWARVWQAHLEQPMDSDSSSAIGTPPPSSNSLLVGSALNGTLAVDWDAIAELESSAPLAGWKNAAAADATTFAQLASAPGLAASSSAGAREAAYRGGGGPRTAVYAKMAASAQSSLEAHALPLLQALRAQTNATNLCIAGGVAQNSVLNGRLVRECGFDRVHIPHCVGDEGIAIGCAIYGAHLLAMERQEKEEKDEKGSSSTRFFKEAPLVPPYLGKRYSAEEVADAVAEFEPFLQKVNPFQDSSSSFEDIDDVSLLAIALQELQVGTDEDVHHNNSETLEQRATAIVYAARALARGELIGWHQGRSEFGPRALGSRSLLADPRNATLAAYLNAEVKKREAFRPFAPAVLAEEADDWFMDLTADGSPFMGLTVPLQPSKVGLVPGIVHGADDSARLQTVEKGLAPAAYRALIAVFFALTGVPLVLNTSFNVFPGEPIVESPRDGVRAFLGGKGPNQRINLLMVGPRATLLTPKPCPVDLYRAHGENACLYDHDKNDDATNDDATSNTKKTGVRPPRPLVPKRRVSQFRSETSADEHGAPGSVRIWVAGVTADAARWVNLFDALELAILEACDGTRTITELIADFVAADNDDEGDEGSGMMEEEGEVNEEEILVRLQRLWDLTLVHF